MSKKGWAKSHRSMLDNPIVMKTTDHFAVWMYLVLSASSKTRKAIFKNEEIVLKPGQLITGRKAISEKFKNLNESKVQRVLKDFENAHQIEQQTSSQNRLITLINWKKYQGSEQRYEQQVNNERTTTEQQVNNERTHNKNRENIKNRENDKNEREGNKIPPAHSHQHKISFGLFHNVLLTDKEVADLESKYPDLYKAKIERLSSYIESTGKEYKSHYAVLLQWLAEDLAKGEQRRGKSKGNNSPYANEFDKVSQERSYDIEKLEKISIDID
jgi:hypothetical protein